MPHQALPDQPLLADYDAAEAAARLERAHPADIVAEALERFPGLSISFSGAEDAALIDMAHRAAGAGGPAPWGPFAAGQICMAGQLFAVLVAWASQIAYFQHELAHPTYVARARLPRTRRGG